MPFPNSPTNGQLATVNNLVYVYNSAKGVWNKANVSAPLLTNTVSISSLSLSSGLNSAGTTTGALVVTGGIGLGGNIFTGGNAIVQATTISSSVSSGALIVNGGAGIAGQLNVGGNITVTGNVLPSANVTYDLGSPTQRWRDLYLSGNTVYFGGATLQTDNSNVTISNPQGGSFKIGGTADSQGNLTAGNLLTSHTITTSKVNNTGQFYYNSRTISANVTIAATENAMSVGPITIADGVEIVINDGGEWSIV